jgi:hypothetical protein
MTVPGGHKTVPTRLFAAILINSNPRMTRRG